MSILALLFVPLWSASPSAAAPLNSTATSVAAAIQKARLAEPLVRTAPTTPAEDLALSQAVLAFERARPGDVRSLTGYVARFPKSGWNSALLTSLGVSYLHDGYFSRAIEAWRGAWVQGKNATEPHARAVVDRAVGELARLYASLGQFDNLTALFDEISSRPISGSATEDVQEAREDLLLLAKDPRHLFNCGPVALAMLMLAQDARDHRGDALPYVKVGANGASLAELAALAHRSDFPYRLIWRAPGQAVPVPGLVHWKVGHYAAIVGVSNGRYHIEDAAFPTDGLWVTRDALDAESSGYFLVPANGRVADNWRAVDTAEASRVWGKGPTSGTLPGDAGDPKAHGKPGQWGPRGGRPNSGPPSIGGPNHGGPGGGPNHGCPLCGYDIKESAVGLTLSDMPVGYSPPIGPSAKVEITYNQREDSQPANFNFFNVSPKWTLNWLTYVTDDPTNPGASVSRYLPGGGAFYYGGYNSGTGQFAAQFDDGSILVLASQSPITYRRQLGDGSVEIYAQSNGATSFPRNIFLSQVIDPQGNAITLNYDSQQRLISLTDAVGRTATFAYDLFAQPLLVTRITDPFGRAATLTYDSSGRLSSITDIVGLTSSFAYDANSLVDAMTTPYGTTSFAYTAPGASSPPRFVQVTDPLGLSEREEWLEPAPIPDSDPAATVPQGMPATLSNQYLTYRDSFYWDRNAYVAAGCTPTGGCDYSKARDRHFTHPPLPYVAIKSTTLESVKYPLENRIWFTYPGQTLGNYAANFSQPDATGRVLDDGTTQLTQTAYDTAGYFNITQLTDAVGRITSFAYSNQIDLTSVTQTTAGGVQQTTDVFTYNSQHEPLQHTDAAGRNTQFHYNATGQLISLVNQLSQKTVYNYNTTHDLTSVVNANNVTSATYTYDAFDRIAAYTDSEGWVASYAYDAADRPTSITYPDGASEIYTYNKLDLATFQDRLGRVWRYAYDADRRLTSVTDPSNQQTQFAYNPIGEITSRTDPIGNITQWAYDVEGRLTTKTFADTSTVSSAYESTTSRLKSTTDALGQTRQFSYAQDDRLSAIAYLGPVNPTPGVSFVYDPYFPRVVSMSDGAGLTQYAYGDIGHVGALQVKTETTPLASGIITYGYDQLGRLSSRVVSGSAAETFGYDAIGRLTSHAGDLGSFTLSYLGQTGQIASRQLGGTSLATSWSYLPNSGDRRLAGISTAGLSVGQSTAFTLTSNAGGFITGQVETSDASLSYPPNIPAMNATFNSLNQMATLNTQALAWDANGNLTGDGTHTYSWDAENRLIAVGYVGQPTQSTTFAYDGLGRRVTITSTPAGGSAVATSYIWCGMAPCQARNSANAVTRAYYAEGEFTPGSPSVSAYYAPDQIGSARRVFTAASAPVYDFDPYGTPLQATAPATDYLWAGMLNQADAGLYLTPARAYSPTLGRWLSRDPVGEETDPEGNLYVYVGSEPLNRIDPTGEALPSFPFWVRLTYFVGALLTGQNPNDQSPPDAPPPLEQSGKLRPGGPTMPSSAGSTPPPPPPTSDCPPGSAQGKPSAQPRPEQEPSDQPESHSVPHRTPYWILHPPSPPSPFLIPLPVLVPLAE